MGPNLKLAAEIDKLKKLLESAIRTHGNDLRHPAVLEISKKLDLFIVRYYGGLSFTLDVQPDDEKFSYTLRLEGILDYSTVDFLEDAIEKIGVVSQLTIDFSGLKFIDSTGIASILKIIFLSKERGFNVEFEAFDESMRESFESVGILRVLEAMGSRGKNERMKTLHEERV